MLNKIILNSTYEFNAAKTVFTLHKYYDSNNVKPQVCTSAFKDKNMVIFSQYKNSQTSTFKVINTTLTLNVTTHITIFEGAPQDFSPYCTLLTVIPYHRYKCRRAMIDLRSKSVLWSVSARTPVLSGQHSGVISFCTTSITSSHGFSHLIVRSALLPLLVVSAVAVTCKEQQTAVRRTTFIFTGRGGQTT